MRVFAFERRWRDALLDAMIPAPSAGLPPMSEVDRAEFWPRFERSAPTLLALGFRLATLVLVVVAPFLLGHRRTFVALDAAGRDDVLRRLSRIPGCADLALAAKLVACFAYFDDARVQATIRGAGAAPPRSLPLAP